VTKTLFLLMLLTIFHPPLSWGGKLALDIAGDIGRACHENKRSATTAVETQRNL
jgi:hypothetical protein